MLAVLLLMLLVLVLVMSVLASSSLYSMLASDGCASLLLSSASTCALGGTVPSPHLFSCCRPVVTPWRLRQQWLPWR